MPNLPSEDFTRYVKEKLEALGVEAELLSESHKCGFLYAEARYRIGNLAIGFRYDRIVEGVSVGSIAAPDRLFSFETFEVAFGGKPRDMYSAARTFRTQWEGFTSQLTNVVLRLQELETRFSDVHYVATVASLKAVELEWDALVRRSFQERQSPQSPPIDEDVERARRLLRTVVSKLKSLIFWRR